MTVTDVTDLLKVFITAAGVILEQLGVPLSPFEQPACERFVAALRASLGETAFATAWVAGRDMAPGRAVQYALEDC